MIMRGLKTGGNDKYLQSTDTFNTKLVVIADKNEHSYWVWKKEESVVRSRLVESTWI